MSWAASIEAQRRYLESVSHYARRLFHQMAVPDVDRIDGLPPAAVFSNKRLVAATTSQFPVFRTERMRDFICRAIDEALKTVRD